MAAQASFLSQIPTDVDVNTASQLQNIIAASINEATGEAMIGIRSTDGTNSDIVLTENLTQAFLSLLRMISSGQVLRVIPYQAELTTQQAADLLNVSRPYFISLLENGKISYYKVGRHRRVRAEDVFQYETNRNELRESELSAIAEIDAELI